MGYTIFGKVETLEEFEKLQKEIEKENVQDIMIRAANKAKISSHQLMDAMIQSGLTGVYNLGMQHMLEYIKGDD